MLCKVGQFACQGILYRSFLISIVWSQHILISTKVTMATSVMRAAQFDEPGAPSNLYVGSVPVPTLKEKELLIKVYATAINRADTLQRKGRYPPPKGASSILGLEATGIVESVGPGCSDRWKKGDRVLTLLPGGGNAEYVAAHEGQMMAVPSGLSWTEAAAIPEVWLTAYQLLHFVGKVKPGEHVLVHAGGSGVGTAAVQLIRLAGAVPIVTAGSEQKIKAAVELGADVGFNYKEGSFVEKVLNHTNGKGVELVLDCVGSNFWEWNADSLALEGRWIVYGTMSGGNVNGAILSKIIFKRLTVIGSTLRARTNEYKAALVGEFSEKALPYFTDGKEHKLKTIIDTVFPLDDIGKAHQYMEDNKNTGKIIISVRDETTDPHQEL
ncbi:quinone oxidoreductase PIG3-like [Ptychodera flava]|uniref:quinone oxidoreductase PIG3-like n=1 Tax=Ptychodera flava TaxID=63121 RepID=UPI00396A08FB